MHFPSLPLVTKQSLLSRSRKQPYNLKRKNLLACCRPSCHKLSRMSFVESVCHWTWPTFARERWQSDLLSKPGWNRTFLLGLKCKFYSHGLQNNEQHCLVSQIDAQTVNKSLSRLPSDKTSAFQRYVWKSRIGDKTWNNSVVWSSPHTVQRVSVSSMYCKINSQSLFYWECSRDVL